MIKLPNGGIWLKREKKSSPSLPDSRPVNTNQNPGLFLIPAFAVALIVYGSLYLFKGSKSAISMPDKNVLNNGYKSRIDNQGAKENSTEHGSNKNENEEHNTTGGTESHYSYNEPWSGEPNAYYTDVLIKKDLEDFALEVFDGLCDIVDLQDIFDDPSEEVQVKRINLNFVDPYERETAINSLKLIKPFHSYSCKKKELESFIRYKNSIVVKDGSFYYIITKQTKSIYNFWPMD